MSNILCIDTTGENALVALSREGKVIELLSNNRQQDHASFLQPAIRTLMQQQQLHFADLAAVAVSNGPGSYTGLRVGLAGAKGICYAHQLPLLTLSTLEVMAQAMQLQLSSNPPAGPYLLCPMTDARRMEVFMALYDHRLEPVLAPAATILEAGMFSAYNLPIYFGGSGAQKWIDYSGIQPEVLVELSHLPAALALQALNQYSRRQFADTAYASPFYCKEFYTPAPQRPAS